MSLMPMWPVRWKLSQSPGKSPRLLLARQANALIVLPDCIFGDKLPDVVCCDAWPGGAGADRHAAFVCLARQFGHRSRRAMGRTGDHDAGAGLTGGGTGDYALCRLSLSLSPGDA